MVYHVREALERESEQFELYLEDHDPRHLALADEIERGIAAHDEGSTAS